MLEDVQNSNWGTARNFTSAELVTLASAARPRDFFLFVPPKPPDQRFPIKKKDGGIAWLATPEESRSSQLADVVVLNLWTQISPGSDDDLLQDNSGVLIWVEVEWGSGGTNVTARVDVGRGTQLVMPADAIVCRIGCTALPTNGPKADVPWNPLPIQINAMVGRYAGAASWRPKKTEFISALATTQTALVRVPSFAWGVRAAGQRSELNNAAITVQALTNQSAVPWSLDTWPVLLLKDSPDYFPIPNGTEYMLVTNGSGNTISLMALEFALAL